MIGALAGVLVVGVLVGAVLGRRRDSAKTPDSVPAQLPAQAQGEKSCAETPAQPTPNDPPSPAAQEELREKPDPPSPAAQEELQARCIVGIRPDGRTILRMRAPPSGWSSEIMQLRELASAAQRPARVAGQSALYRIRDDALEIHCPNRARLIVNGDKAELVVEARALDLGGIVNWGAEYLPWASRCLVGERCDGLGDAARAGWRLVEIRRSSATSRRWPGSSLTRIRQARAVDGFDDFGGTIDRIENEADQWD